MNDTEYKELLDKFYDGSLSKPEADKLYARMSAGVDKHFDNYSRRVWESAEQSVDEPTVTRMRSDLLNRISMIEDRKEQSRKGVIVRIAKYCVAASLIAAAMFGGYRLADHNAVAKTFEVAASRGQKSEVTLPDGSVVWLNSASSITYTSEYNDKQRVIRLQGEAYFEVAPNKAVPFIVKADNVDIVALGTKFDVKAYGNDPEIVTTLVEGKVRTSCGENYRILNPNEQSVYNRLDGTIDKHQVAHVEHAVPWRNNELVFEGENLGQIAEILQRMYNVEIIFSDESVMNYSYSGVVRNNSLNNVLDLITSTSPVKYRTFGNTIKLSRK